MATLTAAVSRAYALGDIEEYPVIADDIIYEGAVVGTSGTSGYARPLVSGDAFLGFAEATADNSGGANGAVRVRVKTRGRVQLTPIAGATSITGNSRVAIYASDDNTFTINATGTSLIGYISRWVSEGVYVVEFDSALAKAAKHA